VSYENLAVHYRQVIDDVLDYLGVHRPVGFVLPTANLAKQADDQSEQWVDAYRSRRDQLLPLTDQVRWCRDKKVFERR
jgi:LPS sulfotransferase NodH